MRVERKRWIVAGTVAIVIALTAADLASQSVRRYWLGHSMASSIVSGLVLLAATVLVLDDILQRRETAKYRRLAAQARLAIRERVQEVLQTLEAHYNDAPDLPRARLPRDARAWADEEATGRTENLAGDEEWRARLYASAVRLSDRVETNLTAWSPVLLSHPDLIGLANRFAAVLNALRALVQCYAAVSSDHTAVQLARQLLRAADEAAATELWIQQQRPADYRPNLWWRFKYYWGIGNPIDFEEIPAGWYEDWTPPRPEDLMHRVPEGFVMPPPPDNLVRPGPSSGRGSQDTLD